MGRIPRCQRSRRRFSTGRLVSTPSSDQFDVAEAFDAGITLLDPESEEASSEASIEDRGEKDERCNGYSRDLGEPVILHSPYGSRTDITRNALKSRHVGEAPDTAEEASGIEVAIHRQRHYG